jgi:GNAT superfamily N-acetyltransferase
MASDELPDLDTTDRQRVYEYIREHEPVSPETPNEEQVVSVTPDRYWQILAVLQRDGYVTKEEGKLRDAYEPSGREEHAGEEIDFTVREARLDDISGLAGVIRQVTEGETYIVGESVEDELSNADSLLDDSGGPPTYFVALVDGEVIGWTSLKEPGVEKLEHIVYLTMGLLDEYRGYGIGSALMERAVTWAGTHGYRKVSSNIPTTNQNAIEFLETHGWDTVAVRPDHYLIDDQLVDEVLLDRWT